MNSRIPESLRDHSFGDLDDPAKGGPFLIKRTRGVHHFGRKTPLVPKPGEAVTLFAYTSSDLPVNELALRYTTHNWQDCTEIAFEPAGLSWDTLIWAWVREWRAQLPPQPEGTLLRYQIYARFPTAESAPTGGQLLFADCQSREPQEAQQFAIWYGKDGVPAWSETARIYQIFVDRFSPGEGKDWLQQENLARPFGGTLRGVIEKLSYIRGLGFNAIWLTPIFASPSHHGYDTSDYFQIEPRFGNLTDFQELLAAAHKLGLRVILDFVANHVSDQHPALREALKSPQSPYTAWFKWHAWPEYQSYFNVHSMPELNLAYGSPAREHLFEAARFWLSLGVDGYRLDYAIGPGLDFWVEFRKVCREVNPECWTFGEVTRPADQQLSFAGGLDGTLDFLSCQALRETFAFRSKPISWFSGFLKESTSYFPQQFSRPAFLDNHDMNRFLFAAGGSSRRLRLALSWLYLLPGQPLVYFGTESALCQPRSIHDPHSIGFDQSRLPMNWEEVPAQSDLADLIRALNTLRERFPGLANAERQLLTLDDEEETASWRVDCEEKTLFAFLNRSETTRSVRCPAAACGQGQTTIDLITGGQVVLTEDALLVPPETLLLFPGKDAA